MTGHDEEGYEDDYVPGPDRVDDAPDPVTVVVVVPFAWRRITVVLLDDEGEELLLLTTAVGVEPVRPSKRIV